MTLLEFIRDKREEALTVGFLLHTVVFSWADMAIIMQGLNLLPPEAMVRKAGNLWIDGVRILFDVRVPTTQLRCRLDSPAKED